MSISHFAPRCQIKLSETTPTAQGVPAIPTRINKSTIVGPGRRNRGDNERSSNYGVLTGGRLLHGSGISGKGAEQHLPQPCGRTAVIVGPAVEWFDEATQR